MPDTHTYHEKELLQSIAEGDEQAFAVLFKCYRKKVYSVSLMLTNEESIAEEMVQEVFAKVWKKRLDLAVLVDFDAWIFIVTRNAAYKMLHKIAQTKKVVREAGYQLPAFSSETDDTILFNNYQQVLREAIERLSPQQKTVWLMAKEQGLKRTEIAKKMNIKPDTVKEYLAIASKSIRIYCLNRIGLDIYLLCFWLVHK